MSQLVKVIMESCQGGWWPGIQLLLCTREMLTLWFCLSSLFEDRVWAQQWWTPFITTIHHIITHYHPPHHHHHHQSHLGIQTHMNHNITHSHGICLCVMCLTMCTVCTPDIVKSYHNITKSSPLLSLPIVSPAASSPSRPSGPLAL